MHDQLTARVLVNYLVPVAFGNLESFKDGGVGRVEQGADFLGPATGDEVEAK
jgi:hypothetical protein